MEKEIQKLVDYLEENYHENLNKYEVEKVTGVVYTKFSLIFKQVCGITLKRYIKKRCLTKIIIEIKENSNNIVNSNVLPYSTQNGFYEAFNDEFNISPKKFLYKPNKELLCDKLDVKHLYKKYVENEVILNELLKEYLGNKKCALNYILSLNAYSITNIDENFSHKLGIGYKILNRRFLDEEGELFSSKSLSVDRYIEEINILAKYYDLSAYLAFPRINQWEVLSLRKYYLVKRQMINNLINRCDIISILKVSKLKTIFLHFTNMNKLGAISKLEEIMQYKYYYENGEKRVLDRLDRVILKYISLQDIGIKKYKKIDDLINNMKMELNFDEKELEKRIIKLIKRGLLYLNESYDINFENDLEKKYIKEYKEELKVREKEEKLFLMQLRKIKKYIIKISVKGGITTVKYAYKALKYFNYENYNYVFRYKNESSEGVFNICQELIITNEFLELKFDLSDAKLEERVKEDFRKKILEIIKLIDKGSIDEL